MHTIRRVSAEVLIITVLAGGVAGAAPLIIKPGQDGFVTQPGSTATLPDLPVGFFGMKGGVPSDFIPGFDLPVIGWPPLVSILQVTNFLVGPGCHTGMVNHHCYLQQRVEAVPIYDTVVERTGGTLTGIGDSLSLDIKLVHLSLKSAVPFEVTYGGETPSFFDIFVTLDPVQDEGTLTLHQTANRSGLMDTVLPVRYSVTFRGIDPGDNGPFVVSGLEDVLTSQGNTFGVPEPSLVFLLGLAGVTMLRRRRR